MIIERELDNLLSSLDDSLTYKEGRILRNLVQSCLRSRTIDSIFVIRKLLLDNTSEAHKSMAQNYIDGFEKSFGVKTS